MKRSVIILGICAGVVVAYWLISPLFITREVNEALPESANNVEEAVESPASPAVSPEMEPSAKLDTVLAPPVTTEEEAPTSIVLAEGNFSGRAGHNAEGTARLLKIGDQNYIRFEDDFRVTNGPDLFVYLGKDGEYVASARLDALKGNVGSQNYAIPSSLKVEDYNEVWVWCRAFSVPFGRAEFHK